jgi:hypothetical protein
MPTVEATSKPAESSAKTAGAKARSKKARHGEVDDPFEPGASADKQKKVKEVVRPPDLFHRSNTGRPASPLQPKVKRTIIKEL